MSRNRRFGIFVIAAIVNVAVWLTQPPQALAASRSPVSFTLGQYAGDFVKEKTSGRIWYIDTNDSRRYEVLDTDQDLFARLRDVSRTKAWPAILSVPEVDSAQKPGLKLSDMLGIVHDENNPDLLWHIQKRAYRRQALRSSEDILAYAKNAMVVNEKDLVEYPIAFADFDHAVKDPAKTPDLSASSTRPDLPKFINVSLKEQRIRTYEHGVLVNTFLISSGRAKYATPKGEYSVLRKLPVVHYAWTYGAGNPDNFDLGSVPYNLSIMPHKYIHYAYWHNNFGRTMSHGCINVNLANIKWIYRWADVGTPVWIH